MRTRRQSASIHFHTFTLDRNHVVIHGTQGHRAHPSAPLHRSVFGLACFCLRPAEPRCPDRGPAARGSSIHSRARQVRPCLAPLQSAQASLPNLRSLLPARVFGCLWLSWHTGLRGMMHRMVVMTCWSAWHGASHGGHDMLVCMA